MLTFTHPGKIGDLLYSLHYCLDKTVDEFEDKFIFNIKTNTAPIDINPNWHDSNKLLSDKDAQFIKPLLEAQPYIEKVTINAKDEGIQLSKYMCCSLNQMGGDIRDYYYQVDGNTFPREFWYPLIGAKENDIYKKYADRFIITYTGRYSNVLIDLKALAPYAEHFVFLGTDEEHEHFKKEFFDVTGMIPTEEDSLLDCAEFMATCRGFIGGQSGLYALAEMMKIPRILLTPDWLLPDGVKPKPGEQVGVVMGPKNVNPLGGVCCTSNRTERLISVLETLLKERPLN